MGADTGVGAATGVALKYNGIFTDDWQPGHLADLPAADIGTSNSFEQWVQVILNCIKFGSLSKSAANTKGRSLQKRSAYTQHP